MMVGASQEIGAMGRAVETYHNTRSRGKKDTSLHEFEAPRKITARVIVQPAETSVQEVVIGQGKQPVVQQDAVTMASLSAIAVQTEPQLADEKIAALVQQNTILAQRVGTLEELIKSMQSRAETNSTFALYLMGEVIKLTQTVDSVGGQIRVLGDRVAAIESFNALMYPVPPDINHTPDTPF